MHGNANGREHPERLGLERKMLRNSRCAECAREERRSVLAVDQRSTRTVQDSLIYLVAPEPGTALLPLAGLAAVASARPAILVRASRSNSDHSS